MEAGSRSPWLVGALRLRETSDELRARGGGGGGGGGGKEVGRIWLA